MPPPDTTNSAADANEERALQRARFIDRFVAFSLDYFLILLASYVILFAVGKTLGSAALAAPLLIAWLVFWLSAFMAYHAFFTSGGRTTLGKRLLGIQVFTQDGLPLPFNKALVRAVCYIVSSVCFGLGFLWALFDAQKRTWHDRITGTMVLETREKSGFAKFAVVVAALFFVAAGGALMLWPVAAPHYQAMQFQANARQTLAVLSQFEEAYKARAGTYTGDVNELGKVYGNSQEFVVLLSHAFDLRSLTIQADKTHYHISARALDEAGTSFEITGPR